MHISLPFKVWTGALIAHAIATSAALFFAQPAQALSFLVHFDRKIAAQCATLSTWAQAKSCVGTATQACYNHGKHWTDGQGHSIRNLVLGDCSGRELSFWDKELGEAYARNQANGAVASFSLEEWRAQRNPTCWNSSKPTLAQSLGLNRPHHHIADCSIPVTAKLFFELRTQD